MTRRESREQAFALVFEMSFQNLPVKELAEGAADCRDLSVDEYAIDAATAVQRNQAAIDSIIELHSTKWKLGRLPRVTLSILRLAIGELSFMEGVPESAVINEAVELAKKYGGEEDPSYVNGVLGGYVRKKSEEAKA
ncbi:MAG: transcription antitermination factor NusB [Angelakisella sp.]